MASVLSTIETDVKKFFSTLDTDAGKFASAFLKFLGKVPSAAQVVDNFLAEVGATTEAALALADPAVEPEVAAALAVVETGIGAIGASAEAAISGTSLLTGLQNFATTVPTLLIGLTIKNPALQAEITKIVNLITNEAKVLIPAVEAWVQQIAGKPAA